MTIKKQFKLAYGEYRLLSKNANNAQDAIENNTTLQSVDSVVYRAIRNINQHLYISEPYKHTAKNHLMTLPTK